MTLSSALPPLQKEAGCRAYYQAADLTNGVLLAESGAQTPVRSASLIKVPILFAALDAVREGALSLGADIPISPAQHTGDSRTVPPGCRAAPLSFLLDTMTADSDNTAANVLMDLLHMERVNALCRALGLTSTCLRRHMLDFAAAARGEENFTSAADMLRLFSLLYDRRLLTPALCGIAEGFLLRQKAKDCVLFPMPQQKAAHKTGELPGIRHDAGLLYGARRTVAFAFLTEADGGQDGRCFLRAAGGALKALL